MNQTADSARSAVFSVATERSPRFGRLAVRNSFVHAFEVDIEKTDKKAWCLIQYALRALYGKNFTRLQVR